MDEGDDEGIFGKEIPAMSIVFAGLGRERKNAVPKAHAIRQRLSAYSGRSRPIVADVSLFWRSSDSWIPVTTK